MDAATTTNKVKDRLNNYISVGNLRQIHIIFIILVVVLIYINIVNYNPVFKTLVILAVMGFGAMDTWNIIVNVAQQCSLEEQQRQQ